MTKETDVIRNSINKRKAAENINKKGKKSRAKNTVQDDVAETNEGGEEDFDDHQENTESCDA